MCITKLPPHCQPANQTALPVGPCASSQVWHHCALPGAVCEPHLLAGALRAGNVGASTELLWVGLPAAQLPFLCGLVFCGESPHWWRSKCSGGVFDVEFTATSGGRDSHSFTIAQMRLQSLQLDFGFREPCFARQVCSPLARNFQELRCLAPAEPKTRRGRRRSNGSCGDAPFLWVLP